MILFDSITKVAVIDKYRNTSLFDEMVNSFAQPQFDPGNPKNSEDLGTILEVSEQIYVKSFMPFKSKASPSPPIQNGVHNNHTKSTPKLPRKNGHMRHSNSLIDFKSLYDKVYCNDDDLGSTSDSELMKPESKSSTIVKRSRRSSILSTTVGDISSTDNISAITIKAKQKKKVSFADEKGQRLVKVKVMSEPSDTPPFLSANVFKQLEDVTTTAPLTRQWQLHFAQPASQYLALREKIDQSMVSLENVIIEPSSDYFSGTVKVKNIGFEKEVFLRISYDKWSSFIDEQCQYLASSSSSILSNDTFTFRFNVPQDLCEFDCEHRVEFCVCFRCNNNEYWDSNHSNNYVLTHKVDHNHQPRGSTTPPYSLPTQDHRPNFENFSTELTTTYRAWKHFDEELRYY